MFPHRGMDTILGKGKKDISMLMTYVAIDKYLGKGGKLGFLITQSVFKTAGAGQGFRRFRLGSGEPVQVQHVDDMVELQPFEGASNRTSVVILQKGRQTKYPMPSYLYWKKIVRGKSIAIDSSLNDVLKMTERKGFTAQPVDEKDPTSSWLTGKPKAIKAVKTILGQSDYVAHEGVNTGGANGVFWVDIINRRPDGPVIISNITEGAKRKVENVQAAIEPDLLYPLLRGRDVKRWCAESSAHILMVQDPDKRCGIDEDEMKTNYPKTYLYLKRFEATLRERKSRGVSDMVEGGAPFYTMFAVGDYTFAPYKVVWRYIATEFTCAVTAHREEENLGKKLIIPDHRLMIVPLMTEEEAYYLCTMLNSNPARFLVQNYIVETQISTHALRHVRIPKFNPADKVHQELAGLSQNAHYATEIGGEVGVREIERRIDELAAQIWELTAEELKDIQTSLEEIA